MKHTIRPSPAKKPLGQWTVATAATMTPTTAAAPSGVNRPAASSTPLPNSVHPSRAACGGPGRKPGSQFVKRIARLPCNDPEGALGCRSA